MAEIIHGDGIEVLRNNNFYANLILTDPPYDWDETRRTLYHEFLLNHSDIMIVFCPPENLWYLPADQHLFWIKPISTKNTSKNYSRFVECMLVYGRGTWNTHRHWSQYTNVFTDLVDEKHHQYRKPPSLIERLILNHTNEGNLLIDPFCGSGTIIEVAERLGRNGIGIEADQDTWLKTCNRLSYS